ncbi:hypothetical protein EON65_38415 [archaeon]|nr:MAG: hypothetical protein EON65_38415 [archaeon]
MIAQAHVTAERSGYLEARSRPLIACSAEHVLGLIVVKSSGTNESFNLRVLQMTLVSGAAAQSANDFIGCWYISMPGCEIMQQTYNHQLGTLVAEAPLVILNMSASAVLHQRAISIGNNLLQFKPPQSGLGNIMLDFRTLESVTGKVAQTIRHFILLCDIFPILHSRIVR